MQPSCAAWCVVIHPWQPAVETSPHTTSVALTAQTQRLARCCPQVQAGVMSGVQESAKATQGGLETALRAALEPALRAALEPALGAALESALGAALEPALRAALADVSTEGSPLQVCAQRSRLPQKLLLSGVVVWWSWGGAWVAAATAVAACCSRFAGH
jgi:hypothetical protein